MYNSNFEIFENDDGYENLIEILYDYGDSHENMHNCFEMALTFVKNFEDVIYPEDERIIKETLFDMLEEVVIDQVEDFIRHRWEFKEHSTYGFLRLLSDPIEALACTHQLFLGSKCDQEPEGIGNHRLIH